jgi:hypothetical protein
MASFHKLGLAAKIPGFHQAYLASISDSKDEAVRANPISDAIAEIVNFEGTTQELLQKLKDISDDPKVQKLTTRALGRFLKGSLKSDLESIGIRIDSFRSAKCMNWIISRTDIDIDAKKTTLTTQTTEPAPRLDSSCVVIDRANYSNYTNYTKTTREGEVEGRAEQDDPPFASLEDAQAAAEVVKDLLKDNKASFTDMAEVFSWVDRSLWDKLSQFLSPDEVQKIATYFPPALPALKNGRNTSINGGGNRKISVGDRVRYVGKDHWQVCGDRVLTVKAIVTYPKWWIDKTIPIADLELVVGQCVKPS